MSTKEEKQAAHDAAIAKNETIIADAIKAADDLKLDAAKFKDVVFEQTLPEGVTPDTVKSVRTADAAFQQAAIGAWGKHAIPALAKDKTVDTASASFGMIGGVSLEVDIHRSKVSRNPSTGEESTNYGVPSARVRTSALRGQGFKGIKENLSILGAKQLAK